jgi:Cys-tRNA synthase (O-phospho-L-seryl-tRNA:Cys-tRNA synthase)
MSDPTSTTNKPILTAIINVAKTVASLTKNGSYTVTDSNGSTTKYFAAEVAGQVAEIFHTNDGHLNGVIDQITKAITGVTNTTVDAAVLSAGGMAKASGTAYTVGDIAEIETPITNF